MSTDFRNSIVRILDLNGETIGTGFVVTTSGLIATCAHVVNDAGAESGDTLELVFHATQKKCRAKVEPNYFRDARAEDVAFLCLDEHEQLPPEIVPLPLVRSYNTQEQPVRTYGFPASKPDEGMWGNCTVLGPDSENGFPVLQLSSPQVSKGFSGAPVWDDTRSAVIGMVTGIVGTRDEKIAGKVVELPFDPSWRQMETAFATPAETLQNICSSLQVSEECPYRNLEPFTEAHAKFFFGRNAIIDKLVSRLREEKRFLMVLGPSGSGKSSVVRAGLLPRLQQGVIEDSNHWEVIIIRPNNDPFKQLSSKGIMVDPPDLTSGVQTWLAQRSDQTQLVLVIDQFEELLTTCASSLRKKFVEDLTHLLEAPLPVTIIITMRDDFYSQFAQRAILVDWLEVNQVNIPPILKQTDVISIVQEPAKLVGLRFEDGLVETIVNDAIDVATFPSSEEVITSPLDGEVTRSTILPLLEFALTQLWEKRDKDGVLTFAAYKAIGGVKGGLTEWATQAFYGLKSEEKKSKARRIFTDLVHMGDKDQGLPDSRQRIPLAALYRNEQETEEVDQVVDHLTRSHLLVTTYDSHSKQGMVEIIHEALIWEWRLLKQWLENDRKFLVWHQEFVKRVRAWVETNANDPTKRDVYKLFGGSDLEEAVKWLNDPSKELRQDEQEFIKASQKQQEQENQKRRQEEQFQTAQKRHRLWTRRAVVGGLVAVGASLGGVIWWDQSQGLHLFSPRGALIFTYTGHVASGLVFGVAWSPDGQRIASASSDHKVDVCDATDGGHLLRYYGHKDTVVAVAWSPDGKSIASASDDKTIQVWDAMKGKQLLLSKVHSAEVHSVAWSPDGKYIASGSNDGTASVWNIATGEVYIYRGHSSYVWNVAWSPNGKQIASASSDKTVHVWDAFTGKLRQTYQGHTDELRGVGWSPDGKYIASSGRDATVQVWDAASGVHIYTYSYHANIVVDTVAWSPNSQRIASAGGRDDQSKGRRDDHTVQVWNALDGKDVWVYDRHAARVHSVAWSPDGTRIVSGSYDGTAQVWKAV